VGGQDIGSPGGPVSSGLQVPVSRDIVVQEQDPFGEIPAAFFLQKSSIAPAEMSNTLR